MLPLAGSPCDRPAAGSDGDRVIEVFSSRARGGRIGLLLLRFGLARHDLDVPYVDELPAVLTKRDVLNFKSCLHSLPLSLSLRGGSHLEQKCPHIVAEPVRVQLFLKGELSFFVKRK